jgi:hypothetical protein
MGGGRRNFTLAALGLAACCVLSGGCARGSPRENMGLVAGTVTFGGKPLSGGTIHFVRDGGKKTVLWIRANGTYSGEVPLGPARVAIETESAKYKDRDRMMDAWEEQAGPSFVQKKQRRLPFTPKPGSRVAYVKIPTKYSSPSRSGFRVEIIPGRQQLDFDLK